MKKWMVFPLILLSFSLVLGLSASLAFVSPTHYERIKQERESKKKTTQAPKMIHKAQVVQLNQKNIPQLTGEEGRK